MKPRQSETNKIPETGPLTERPREQLVGVLQSATPPTSPESSVHGKFSQHKIYSHSVHGGNIYASRLGGVIAPKKNRWVEDGAYENRENDTSIEIETSALERNQSSEDNNIVSEEQEELANVHQQLAEYLRISHSGRVQDLRQLSHWVFVYGTLKRSFPNSHLLEDGALFEGDFMTCDKYPLVIGGPYYSPYLLDMKGYGNNVRGELYRVSNESLKELDKLENVGVNYTRRVIPVYSVKDRSFIVKAFAYLKCNYTNELLNTNWLSDYQDHRYVPRHLRPKDNSHQHNDNNAPNYRKIQSMQDMFSSDTCTNDER
ncbi:hypothetical protein GAYE_SCF17G3765 [Galdieria yellowstonensis]|uniref:Gamma-glutamylcyclotransferase family protein n=1 Tax=Galdieria yellowstonensis TaxID=3028027 RepID=A0AAV9IF27_9RHOD|nr:hypothetical protein GAYE_SCF17G3765 [Galdieria yellowstonensis]